MKLDLPDSKRTEDGRGLERGVEGRKRGRTKWKKTEWEDGREDDEPEPEPEPWPLVPRLTAGPESGNTAASSSDVELGPCWYLRSSE